MTVAPADMVCKSRGSLQRPFAAFDTQMQLARDCSANPAHRLVTDWYIRAGVTPFDPDVSNVDRVLDRQRHSLLRAPTYWVSETMTDYLLDAVATVPDQPLYETDLPALDGFMVFERPLMVQDSHGEWCNIRAVLWQAVGIGPLRWHPDGVSDPGGVVVTMFSDWHCAGDSGADIAREAFDRKRSEGLHVSRPALSLYHIGSWAFGRSLGIDDINFDYGMTIDGPGGEMLEYTAEQIERSKHSELAFIAFLTTTWTLMQHRVSDIGEWVPSSRRERKAADRAAQDRVDPPDIVTISLRRPARAARDDAEPGEGLSKEHDYRWVRRAHWRWQWYPSYRGPCTHCRVKDGEPCMREDGEHRRIWIDEMICGPEDKPLKPRTNTVYKVVR